MDNIVRTIIIYDMIIDVYFCYDSYTDLGEAPSRDNYDYYYYYH